MLTMTDLFCGAGGSSSGAISVPGVQVRMAANHWELAVETHNTNHPLTDHDLADISQVDPRRYPTTDILWASPECTNHSVAKARKRNIDATPDLFGDTLPDAAADRSRATMWDVPRFAERHHYRAIIVENVVEAANWIMWPAWLHAMDCLGYDHRTLWLNSMHTAATGNPAPQSRDRLYVLFWRRGDRTPDVDRWTRPQAHCAACETDVHAVQSWKKTGRRWGRYRTQYVYRCPNTGCRNEIVEPNWQPASAAIDWTIPGTRIGDRATLGLQPLKPKTRARIEAGLRKHATSMLVPVEGRDGKTAVPVDQPMRSQTCRNETALMVPLRNNNTAKPVTQPLDTFAASGQHHALVMRNNSSKGDGAEHCTPTHEPLRTLTTTGHQSLVTWDEPPDIDDCLFRMLTPHEIQAGMAFAADYTVLGNKREQVRQLGGAVTPPTARDLIACAAEALNGGTS